MSILASPNGGICETNSVKVCLRRSCACKVVEETVSKNAKKTFSDDEAQGFDENLKYRQFPVHPLSDHPLKELVRHPVAVSDAITDDIEFLDYASDRDIWLRSDVVRDVARIVDRSTCAEKPLDSFLSDQAASRRAVSRLCSSAFTNSTRDLISFVFIDEHRHVMLTE
jgi:hypothetical protein